MFERANVTPIANWVFPDVVYEDSTIVTLDVTVLL